MSIINLFTPNWDIADSYGRKATELAEGLDAKGYHVNRWGDDACECAIKPATGGIFLGYPTQYADYMDMFPLAGMGTTVAVTAWESTEIPEGWAEALNQMDAVSVGSQFVADVFRENGVQTPISVHPLGVSDEFFDVQYRTIEDDEPLTFLCFADRNYRKGWRTAFHAFRQAFDEDADVRLLIKSRGRDLHLKDDANVEILMGDYSNAEMVELYHQSHVLLFPTHGEGFGLPPREFAATGGVVLATNWSGTADGIAHWGVPLPYQPGESWINDLKRNGLGQWAHVDVDALARLMQHVHDYYRVYADFGLRAAGYVQVHYRWSHFVDQIERMWIEAGGSCPQAPQKPNGSGAKQVTTIRRSQTMT